MTDKPEFTLRDGAIKATVWRNQGEKGEYFTASLCRTYRDEKSGELRDTNSFSGADLLKISSLAKETYLKVSAIRQNEKLRERRARQGAEDEQPRSITSSQNERSRQNRRDSPRENGRGR